MYRLALLSLTVLCACYDAHLASVEEEPLDADLEDASWVEDGGTPWTPPPAFDGAVPPEDPGPGLMVYEVTALRLGADGDAGFDLDGFDTRSRSDAVGCGLLDGAAGVDNQLESLLGMGSSFGFDVGSLLLGTDLELTIEIRGYEGPSDDWVRADILAGGSLIAENAPGSVSEGTVEIHFAALPLPLAPGLFDTFTLPLDLVRLRFDIEAPEATEALLGGALVWDDGTEADLESVIRSLLESFVGFFPIDLLLPIITRNLDISLTGVASPCNAISLAAFVDVERITP